MLGVTERHMRRMCSAGKFSGAVKDGKDWNIPLTADIKRLACVYACDSKITAELNRVSRPKREDAMRRLGLIQSFEKFSADFVRDGGNRTKAINCFCSGQDINWRSFMRWISDYRDQGIIGLVDKRGRGKYTSHTISPDAWKMFEALWLDLRQPTVKNCWQNLTYINHTQSNGWDVPSLRQMYRLVEDRIPMPVQVLHREGLAAYEAKCAPYIQIDPDSVEPGAVFIGDHHQFNVWVWYRGRWVRPWITAWEDMRSRAIVGWHISASPNQTTIMLAMRGAIEIYGPPDSVKIDNGKDYDSEMWTGATKAQRKALKAGYIDESMVAGIYALMGVGVSFSIPYHPQSKPIERFFDTMDVQFVKSIETYCGKDSDRKPEYLNDLLKSEAAKARALSIEEFTELVGSYIQVYNKTSHTGTGMNGRSPAEVISLRTSRRVMAEGVLDLLMRVWSGELKVGKNGVRFKGMYYGQFDSELLMMQSKFKKVRLAYDPDDLSEVHVYDATTWQFVTVAQQNKLVAYGRAVDEESLREAARQKAKALKATRAFKDSRLAANMDLTSLTIKAMADAVDDAEPEQQQQSLRPVASPLNSQVKTVKRHERRRAVRKAVGAEGITDVVNLDIDFSEVVTQQENYADVDLDMDFSEIKKDGIIDLKFFND